MIKRHWKTLLFTVLRVCVFLSDEKKNTFLLLCQLLSLTGNCIIQGGPWTVLVFFFVCVCVGVFLMINVKSIYFRFLGHCFKKFVFSGFVIGDSILYSYWVSQLTSKMCSFVTQKRVGKTFVVKLGLSAFLL